MDYGKIISRAWAITWNNKYLWLLGFIIALGGGASNGGGGNFNFPSGSGSGGGSGPSNPEDFERFILDWYQQNETLIATIGITLLVLVCGLMLFSLVMWFIRFVAEAGLIQTTVEIENGQVSTFGKAMAAGRPFLLTSFVAKFILYSPFLLIFILALGASGAIYATASTDLGPIIGLISTCLGFLACLFIFPYSFFAYFVYPFAVRGIVLRGLGAMESLYHGWDMVKSHVVDILILGIIFIALQILIGFASLFVTLPILVISAGPAFYSFINEQVPGVGSIIFGAVGVIILIFANAGLNSVFLTMRSVTFTLAYLEWGNKPKTE